MTEPNLHSGDFAVEVEDTLLDTPPTYRVSITTNGYQWWSLPVTFADEARAWRVRDFLRVELAEDVARVAAATATLVRGDR